MNNSGENGLHLSFFTESQCERIFEGALSVLEETGCRIKQEDARALLKQAGCSLEGDIVRIPRSVMKHAIDTMPKTVTLYDRNGEPAVVLDAASNERYCAAGISAMNRIDPHTGKRRACVAQDVKEAAIVEDRLDNIDIACSMTSLTDCPEDKREIHETRLMLEYTTKPFMINSFSPEAVDAEMELLGAVAGSAEAFRAKPFVLASQTAVSPLGHSDDSLATLLRLCEYGVPSVYLGAPSMGGTGPMTMAGSMVVSLADCFVGLLLSQLVREGNPFVACAFVDALDMRTMNFTFSSPEFSLVSMATGDLFRYLGMPYIVHLGGTDAPTFDQQAAFEIGMQLASAAMGNINLSFFLGYLEGAMASSLETLVFGDEAMDYIAHTMRGIEVTDETLDLETIKELGAGGNFLAEDLTLDYMGEVWSPSVFSREGSEQFEKNGSKDLGDRLRERVLALIEEGPREPMDPELVAELDAIMAKVG